MGKYILVFGNIEIQKEKFYCYKSRVFLEDVNIKKVLPSNKVSSDEKNFKYCYLVIDYLHNDHKVKPLHIML